MIGIISAPSNLGLRPPETGAVPGCAKAPEALREAGLHARLGRAGARDDGVVLAGRYRDDWVAGVSRLRNEEAIVDHARRLADRIGTVLGDGRWPLVLGGDCGIVIGAGLALRRRSGRFGLVHLDGHTDFRHPSGPDACHALAGEDLAAMVGLHWDTVADIDGLRPYISPRDTVHLGCRPDDEHLREVRDLLAAVVTTADLLELGVEPAVRAVEEMVVARGLDGYWLHLDVDVLDPAVLPAVDSPAPGGLDATLLTELLRRLVGGAVGMQVTVFDPDLDRSGDAARLLAGIIGDVLTPPP